MGHIITRRYAKLFERKVKNPFLFAYDVHKSGKMRELASFVVWEFLHQLRLFPKRNYLKFTSDAGLALDSEKLSGINFEAKIDHLFHVRGLTAIRVAHDWKLLFIDNNGDIFGCLYPDDRSLYMSDDNGASAAWLTTFPERIKSVFISSQGTIFACARGAVYMSSDRGSSFRKSLDLGSSISFFRHNNGMTELPDKTLIVGEYGNIWDRRGWRQLAYLYVSSDGGNTWKKSDFLIKKGTNKHVHLVAYSRLLNKLFMADGDNYKKLWVCDSPNAANAVNPDMWRSTNRFHIQTGGHTAVVENDEKILFGTDYQGGTNFIVETNDGRNFRKRIVPDPYRRSPIDNMVLRRSKQGNETWANLPFSTSNSRCLLMFTRDGGESWSRVLEYNRANQIVWLISAARNIADDLYFSVQDLHSGARNVYRVSG